MFLITKCCRQFYPTGNVAIFRGKKIDEFLFPQSILHPYMNSSDNARLLIRAVFLGWLKLTGKLLGVDLIILIGKL